jgi:hypothetical protein
VVKAVERAGLGEARAARGHGMWRAIECNRPTNDQAGGLPIADQGSDGGKTVGVDFAANGGQWMSLQQLPLANGDADALLAEVKGEYRACALTFRLRHARLHRQDWQD